MPAFTVTCQCGERFHVEEAHAGRVITCWRCNRKVTLTRPARRPDTPREVKPPRDAPRRATPPRAGARRVSLQSVVARLRRAPRAVHRTALASLPFFHRWRGVGPAALSIASWGFLFAITTVALLMWRVGDRAAIGTILLFVGRWVWAIPLAALAAAAWGRNRALLLPLGAATWVLLFPVMGLNLGSRRLLPTPAGTLIRVVSFNTAAADSVTMRLPALLAAWDADIVAFQECSEGLATALRALPAWHVDASRPLCLISRFPITVAEPMDRASLERVRNDRVSNAIGGAGFVTRYRLDTPAGPVGFTNLHLETARKGLETLLSGFDAERLRENTELRDIESGRAREWVEGGLVPMIVAGDFNASREGRVFADHWGDLTNAFSRVGIGFGTTRYNGWIRMRIDHVLTGVGLVPVRAAVGADAGSDHRPLIVEVVRKARVAD